jgi:hypothetical protein
MGTIYALEIICSGAQKRDMCPETAHYAWLRTSTDVYERIILKSHFQGKEHTVLIFETWIMASVTPATLGREVQIPQHWRVVSSSLGHAINSYPFLDGCPLPHMRCTAEPQATALL